MWLNGIFCSLDYLNGSLSTLIISLRREDSSLPNALICIRAFLIKAALLLFKNEKKKKIKKINRTFCNPGLLMIKQETWDLFFRWSYHGNKNSESQQNYFDRLQITSTSFVLIKIDFETHHVLSGLCVNGSRELENRHFNARFETEDGSVVEGTEVIKQ